MTRNEQAQFTSVLIDRVREEIAEKIESGKIPENWDGIELRRYIARKFEECVMGDMPRRRKTAFENDIIVNNL